MLYQLYFARIVEALRGRIAHQCAESYQEMDDAADMLDYLDHGIPESLLSLADQMMLLWMQPLYDREQQED